MEALVQKLQTAAAPGPDRIIAGAVIGSATKTSTTSSTPYDTVSHVTHPPTPGDLRTFAIGTTSVDPAAPALRSDAVMWAASCTKLITTVAALQCVERGLFTLDEPVSRLLPEWTSPDVLTGFDESTGEPVLEKAKTPITLRQLLTHSSGMAYDGMDPTLMQWRKRRGEEPAFLSADIDHSYLTPLVYEPGTGWAYSPGLDWTGRMIELATSSPRLGSYCTTHIFDPLSMSSTTFQPLTRPDLAHRITPITTRLPSDGPGGAAKLAANIPLPYPIADPVHDEGGAGVHTTCGDYLKLLTSLLRNDGRVLRRESVEMMFAPQLSEKGKSFKDMLKVPEMAQYLTPGMDPARDWTWGLGGAMVLNGLPGRAGRGCMFWGGLPNLSWFIDRESGMCGMYASQLVPPGDPESARLFGEVQTVLFQGGG